VPGSYITEPTSVLTRVSRNTTGSGVIRYLREIPLLHLHKAPWGYCPHYSTGVGCPAWIPVLAEAQTAHTRQPGVARRLDSPGIHVRTCRPSSGSLTLRCR
jgi:hypothetical protein